MPYNIAAHQVMPFYYYSFFSSIVLIASSAMHFGFHSQFKRTRPLVVSREQAYTHANKQVSANKMTLS